MKSLIILRKTRISILTFGGQQFFTHDPEVQGQTYSVGEIVESNESYLVAKNGLNFHVFQQKDVIQKS